MNGSCTESFERTAFSANHPIRRVEIREKGGKRSRVQIYEPNGPEAEKSCGTIYIDPGSVEWFCTQLIPEGSWLL